MKNIKKLKDENANERFLHFARNLRRMIKREDPNRDIVITGGESEGEVGGSIRYTLKEGKSILGKIFGRKLIRIYSSTYGSPQSAEITCYDRGLMGIVNDKKNELSPLVRHGVTVSYRH